ncbi:phage holin family protein [uncultured Castellaniella sp.]|uniref:phage holin family protein n=1 Tax=uncultured Castellaniella sp. TaxID=647907 RepID=UPI002606D461|nr:phage holin family protein [uncultured Castellaniella sp.]
MGAFGRAVADLAAHSAALLGTRLELLGLEAQDVRDRLLGRLALLLAAAVFLLLALLVATLTVALYFWPTEHRFLALWLLALGYAVVGAGLAATLLKRLRQDPAPFAATADVLRQDARAFGLSPADGEDEDEPARSPAVPGEIP